MWSAGKDLTNRLGLPPGPFNSSVLFDKKHSNENHTDVVEELKEKGINLFIMINARFEKLLVGS